jgi:hypothetical protein
MDAQRCGAARGENIHAVHRTIGHEEALSRCVVHNVALVRFTCRRIYALMESVRTNEEFGTFSSGPS